MIPLSFFIAVLKLRRFIYLDVIYVHDFKDRNWFKVLFIISQLSFRFCFPGDQRHFLKSNWRNKLCDSGYGGWSAEKASLDPERHSAKRDWGQLT